MLYIYNLNIAYFLILITFVPSHLITKQYA